jgi:hypothetical protein
MTRLKVTLLASALAFVPAIALAQIPTASAPAAKPDGAPAATPAAPAPLLAALPVDTNVVPAQIAVGTKVGIDPLPSGYDDGGRRDPFVALVSRKAATSDKTAKGGTGLTSIAVADVAVKGIVKAGTRVTAVLEGPDHMSYMAHPQDRLADGLVKSIDPAGVVFVEEETDAAGAVHPHEVRKPLHAAAEVVK